MSALPDPIQLVVIPETFSVSQIIAANDCYLKALMASQPGDAPGQLRTNPSAEFGKLFHSLIEESVQSYAEGKEVSTKSLEKTLDRLLEKTRAKLAGDPQTASYANLIQTLAPLAWERKRRFLIDTAFEFVNRARKGKKAYRSEHKGEFCFGPSLGSGRWVEIPINVTSLRLKGRIDVLERNGNEVKIIDLKSGRTGDGTGDLDPKIVWQLRLYGVLVQTLDPMARVTLIVDDGAEHVVPFDATIMEESVAWLRLAMGSSSPGAMIAAEDAATVGPECRWCKFRHRCNQYLHEAPMLWAREMDWPLPMDIWGTVTGATPKAGNLLNVSILDAAGRQVRVFCIQTDHLGESTVGERLWLFELATSQIGQRGNTWRHPLNFYEIGDASPADRAWGLNVFRE